MEGSSHQDVSRENYLLLGKIDATQQLQLKMLEEMKEIQKKVDERLSWAEKKINYALGIVAAVMVFFQYAWKYFTGK